jgi:hypothetical protein
MPLAAHWLHTGGDVGSARACAVHLVPRRSEMRVVHDASKALGRDIILATTSVETPHTFIDTLYRLNSSGAEW